MSNNQTAEDEMLILVDPAIDLSTVSVYGPLELIYCIVVGLFSSACSMVNMAVLAHSSLKDPLYMFILLISCVDLVYLLQSALGSFLDVRCRLAPYLCSQSLYHFNWWFDFVSYEYVTSCMAIFSILSEIFLTTQRLFLIKNRDHLKSLTWRHVSPVIAVISLIYYAPV
jgi:hypothetical protein